MPSDYAIFSALYAPSMGGVEQFTEHLARQLVSQGDHVTVVTSAQPGLPGREEVAGVSVVRLPSLRLLQGRLPLPKRNHIYKHQWDSLRAVPMDRVVVNTRFYPHSLEGLRLARERDLPALVIEHGSAHLTLGPAPLSRLVEDHEHAITRSMVREYHPRFAGVSRAACAWLAHFGIMTDRVVSNAIDAAAFRDASSSRDLRSELAIPAGRPLAVFAGRLMAEKGVEEVVGAARMLPHVSFVLAGDGPLRSRLEGDCAPLANCEIVGRLDRGDLAALLAQADYLVLPSRSEGMATILLEAGVWGVLPVVSDVGGVAEVTDDGELGRIVAPTVEGIVEGISSLEALGPEGRADLGARLAERIATRFSWAHSARQLDAAFAGEGR